MIKKIIIISILIFILLWIKNSIVASYLLWHKQDLLVEAQKELQTEKIKNAQLKQQLGVVQSNYFIEEEARDRLLMAKNLEKDVIIDKKLLPADQAVKSQTIKFSHWQEWYNLFFAETLDN